MPSALRASAAASGVSRPKPERGRDEGADEARDQRRPEPPQQRHERRPEPALPDVGEERRDDDQRGRFAGRHDQAEEADRDGRQALAEHALDEAGEHEGEARDGESHGKLANVRAWQRTYNASPRIRRGCEAAGATPSRITARRSGPIRSIR